MSHCHRCEASPVRGLVWIRGQPQLCCCHAGQQSCCDGAVPSLERETPAFLRLSGRNPPDNAGRRPATPDAARTRPTEIPAAEAPRPG